jgi:hypothetical protein
VHIYPVFLTVHCELASVQEDKINLWLHVQSTLIAFDSRKISTLTHLLLVSFFDYSFHPHFTVQVALSVSLDSYASGARFVFRLDIGHPQWGFLVLWFFFPFKCLYRTSFRPWTLPIKSFQFHHLAIILPSDGYETWYWNR